MPDIYYDAMGKPIYDKDSFPDPGTFRDAVAADITKRGNNKITPMGPASPPSGPSQRDLEMGLVKKGSRTLANFIPAAGGLLGEMTPAGPVGAIAGGAAGSYGLNELRKMSPDYFGQPSNNPGTGAVLDGLLQGIFGGAGRSVLGGVGSALGKYKIGQGLSKFADSIPNLKLTDILPDTIKNQLPQKMLPLTRNIRGQYNPATYGPNVPDISVIGNIMRLLTAGGTVPPNNPSSPPSQ